jgi:hypothetical protein
MIKIILVLLPSIIFAQDMEIKNLFPGKWKMESNNAVYEEWKIENETELTGKSYSIKNGIQDTDEVLYIKKFADTWAYVAVPEEQDITLFKLVKYSFNKFVFENEEHDFPQKIIYEFNGNGRLTASVEGKVDGILKRKEFSFISVTE